MLNSLLTNLDYLRRVTPEPEPQPGELYSPERRADEEFWERHAEAQNQENADE